MNGWVKEEDYPYTPDTTLKEFYQTIPAELLKKGKQSLDKLQFFYKGLVNNRTSTLLDGMRYSPLQVDVSGSYKMDSDGHILWNKDNTQYIHEVVLFDYEKDRCWYIFDSETSQFLKYDWNYPFGDPMIHNVTKKAKVMLYHKKGQAGIAVIHPTEPAMIAFSGGKVSGDNLFKAIYGATDFNQLDIIEVDEWPHPLVYTINTNLA